MMVAINSERKALLQVLFFDPLQPSFACSRKMGLDFFLLLCFQFYVGLNVNLKKMGIDRFYIKAKGTILINMFIGLTPESKIQIVCPGLSNYPFTGLTNQYLRARPSLLLLFKGYCVLACHPTPK